jgi:hypothetical protein
VEESVEDSLAAWLRQLEAAVAADEDPGAEVALVYLAREDVLLDEDELHGALRRAMLLLAAGGDPRRELEFDGRAVTALADDLDAPERRAELEAALGDVAELLVDLPQLSARLAALRADSDRAWRMLALALLADEFDSDDE